MEILVIPNPKPEVHMLRHVLIPFVLALSSWAFAAPVPVAGRAPVRVDRLRVGNPAVLPMTGTWRFKLDHGVSPAVKGEMPPDDRHPRFRHRPPPPTPTGRTSPSPPIGKSKAFPSPPTRNAPATNPMTSASIAAGSRSRPPFAGQRVLWHFDGVYDGAEVFVNGQRAGYHESGFTAFDIDVTKALKPGQRNLMAVRVYKKTSSGSLDKGDFWCLGGIYRENYLRRPSAPARG